jgi:hypothetical protein
MKRVLIVIFLIVAILMLATVVCAADKAATPTTDALAGWAAAITAICGLVAALVKNKKAKEVAEKVQQTVARVDWERTAMIEAAIRDPALRGPTIERTIVAISVKQKWGLQADTISDLVHFFTPLAKKLKLRLR